MKKISILYVFVVIAFLLSSCNKDFLNTKPLTQFPEGDVWTDPALAQAYVNDLYSRIGFSWAPEAQNVDESRNRSQHGFDFNNMLMSPDNPMAGNWRGYYSNIRACNVFLENVDKIPDDPALIDGKTVKDRMTGEVLFLRAWFYHKLVNYYGGVPLITKAYKLTDDFTVARNSYAECVKFLSDQLDQAASLLPEQNTGADGRATKGAALALKSRVLLYAASDLHNNASIYSGFSNPELLGYTSGSQADRWKAAKDAAKAVIDLGLYSLYKPDPASGEEAAKNIEDFFTLKTSTPEGIFVRYYNASLNKGLNGWDITPNGWWGNAAIGAISELVDDFEMADGSRFSWDNPAQAHEPYKDRDPRFYGTLLYEGAKWRPRPPDLAGIDPVGVLQVGTWKTWDAATGQEVDVYGLDSRNSVANSWNANNTGTVMHKFLDRSVDIQKSRQDLCYRYLRYAEVLLNYAEACNELGEDDEARTYVNMVRKRAFMPDIPASVTGDSLRARIRNERRIELVFEGQRFFDVRRWMIGPAAYHDVHGVKVVYELLPDHTTATIPTITPYLLMTETWDDKAYFMPINRTEMDRNNLLVQNPGYEE